MHSVKIWNEKLQDSLSVYYVVEICEFPWCTSKHKDDEKSSTYVIEIPMLSVKINVFEEIMFQKSYSPIVQGGYGSQLVKNKPLKLKYLEVIFQFSYRGTVIWNVNFRYRYLLPSYHTFLFIVAHDNQKSVKLATQNTYTYIFSYLQHTCIFFVLFYYPQHSYYLLVMIHLLKSYQKNYNYIWYTQYLYAPVNNT